MVDPRCRSRSGWRLTALTGFRLNRPLPTLSGGQHAQVALALAVAKTPEVLLLDEPVAALDPLARAEFLASLATAAAGTGLTVLLSSHLLRDVEQVCDHVVLLTSSRYSQEQRDLETHPLYTRCYPARKERAVGSATPSLYLVRYLATQPGRRKPARTQRDSSALSSPGSLRSRTLQEIVLVHMGLAASRSRKAGLG